ncbi:hypothetical protein [Burkholderia cepacia]|uniref:hypothetical protein n=1 Tax=Burkholderia cepacia TaxID=292 RepID=UPI001CF28B46|nr:hypothetical protein [Burkholderia cepacia]MCA8354201.1 hypothetical protein [Burkholderia cepacia]
MNNNQDDTNETELPNEIKAALTELFVEIGYEGAVLNSLINAILGSLKDEGFQICSPQELMLSEDGQEFITGWMEVAGSAQVVQAFRILEKIAERLPKGAYLTDLTKVELTRWNHTEKGIDCGISIDGPFSIEEEPTE